MQEGNIFILSLSFQLSQKWLLSSSSLCVCAQLKNVYKQVKKDYTDFTETGVLKHPSL